MKHRLSSSSSSHFCGSPVHFFALTPLMGVLLKLLGVQYGGWMRYFTDPRQRRQGELNSAPHLLLWSTYCVPLPTPSKLGKKYAFCLGVTVYNSLLPIHKINEEWESLLIFSLIPISVFGSSRWHDTWVCDHRAESSYEGSALIPAPELCAERNGSRRTGWALGGLRTCMV